MGNLFESASTIQEKREILKQLSKPLQVLAKSEAIENVNEGLKGIYRQEGHITLKTLRQWNKEGKRVRKGERALCLWGKPKLREQKADNSTTEQGKDEKNPLNFFPVCYVFSNQQVQ